MATAKRLVQTLWFVDCPSHGRVQARTRTHWENGFGQRVAFESPDPIIAPSHQDRLGHCVKCDRAGKLHRVRAHAKTGVAPEPCDERCLNATGESCLCVCLGECHGTRACIGHSVSAHVEVSP